MHHQSSIQLGGIKVYFEATNYKPNKKAIIFIHGFLSSSYCFRKLTTYFDQTYSLISMDIPPFGKSEKHSKFVYTYENLGKLIHQLIDQLLLQDVTLVGHSMGGQIIMHSILKSHPKIKRFILLSSSGYLYQVRKPLLYTTYIPFFHLYIKHWITKNGVEGNLKNVIFDHQLIDEEMRVGYEEPFQNKTIFKALTKMLRDREGDLRTQQLNSIQLPCLILWGDHDNVIPLHVGKKLAEDIPNNHFFIITNAGHLLPEERPIDVYEQIIHFIQHN